MNPTKRQEMEHEKSKEDLKKIRGLSLFLPFFHLIGTSGLLIMGYSGGANTDHSETIILGAFGALITSLWAAVSSWETFSATRPIRTDTGIIFRLPPWEWHSTHFLNGIIIWFVLTFCLFPSLMIYIVQCLGGEFLQGLLAGESITGTERNILLFFVFSYGFLVITLDFFSIIYTTKFLAKEQNEQKKINMVDNDVPDEIHVRPVSLKIMACVTFLGNFIFFIAFIAVASTRYNSGTMMFAILQGVMLIALFYFVCKIMDERKDIDAQSWALDWRMLTVVHLFTGWVSFWAALEIAVSLAAFGLDFWDGYSALSTIDKALVACVLGIFFCYMCVYLFFLLLHTRCMSTLDEIASQKLGMDDGFTDSDDDDDYDDEGDEGDEYEEKEDN